ncbi:MAG: HNH endonuclease domain-containing protein [Sulfurimonas sp.]|uniref:HNH endonuclease domain-containing protein n=1 Tax=Sulfurimonas sp. TaxID=2022749 RepID=UPI002634B510|nr:HNH endonuclease domain-containing protein [Sulfurimonas sp.]MDD5372659.1 HNH endonuclease domain-containing protein [Sulfurimonas sp.]
MFKIKFNQELFYKHITEIEKSITKLLTNKLKSKLLLYEKECLNYLKDNLKSILQADNNQMKTYIEHFKINFPKAIGMPNTKEKNWKRLYKILRKDIFEKEYDNWCERKKYGSYEFIKTIDLKTCPYCNRNYTLIVDKESGKLRPEIDHFYPKSIYPFLAMSFYNLIPSCPICNHTKSSKSAENLINPYDIKDDDFKLTYIPNDVNFLQIESTKYNTDSFEIEFIKNNDNIEIFKLDELYKQHKDIVVDLLMKKAYYPKSYIEELENNFGFTKDEIYRLLLNNYKKDDDLHKRPLSKLIKDISEELNLI